jgi:hypothetical protein
MLLSSISTFAPAGLVEGAEVRFQGGEAVRREGAALVFGEIVVDFSGDIGKIFGVRK